MTIRTRILALLILISLFSFGAFALFQQAQQEEAARTSREKERELTLRLQQMVGVTSRSAYRYLRNYSARGAMVEFLTKRDPAWAEKFIKGRMNTYRIDSVWVLQADGAVIYGMNLATDTALTAPPVPVGELEGLLRENDHFSFFANLADGLYQIQGMPIKPPSDLDRRTPAVGWLLAAKHWGQLMVDDLANAGQGKVTLTGPTHAGDVNPKQEVEVWLPLRDQLNRPIAGLDYRAPSVFDDDSAHERMEKLIFGLSCGVIVVLVGLTLHFWILRPFRIVNDSLATLDPAPLGPLLQQRDEFGQMARVVQSFLRDREQLRQNLAERTRLGQELHDGVIQGIYGAGMKLSGVQAQLNGDPVSARRLLNETQTNLNQIIQDLRDHIERVDPKPLRNTFGETVAQLIQQLHGPGPLTSEIDIDEELAASLPPLSRRQVLLFTREALSNALRHGQPTKLTVSWRRNASGSQLVVADDGFGFDQISSHPSGRGLDNLAERAVALGGLVEIDSKRNQGTRLCLKLPPSTPPP